MTTVGDTEGSLTVGIGVNAVGANVGTRVVVVVGTKFGIGVGVKR